MPFQFEVRLSWGQSTIAENYAPPQTHQKPTIVSGQQSQFGRREALDNIWRNRVMSLLAISTVTIALFVLGALTRFA